MPTYELTSPEGQTYRVTGPDGSTPKQAYSILQQRLAQGSAGSPGADSNGVAPQADDSFLHDVVDWVGDAAYAGAQGMGAMGNQAALATNRAIGWGIDGADSLAGLLTGGEVSGPGAWWDTHMVEPREEAARYFRLPDDASTSQQIAHGVGSGLAGFSMAGMTGGEALAPRATASLGEVLTNALKLGGKQMAPLAATQGINTGAAVYDQTGDLSDALNAGATRAGLTAIEGALPMSVPGGIVKRLATGAASGYELAKAERPIMNAVLPESMQHELTPQETASQTVQNTLMAALLGPRAPESIHAPAFRLKTAVEAAKRANKAQSVGESLKRMGMSDEEAAALDPDWAPDQLPRDPNEIDLKGATEDLPLAHEEEAGSRPLRGPNEVDLNAPTVAEDARSTRTNSEAATSKPSDSPVNISSDSFDGTTIAEKKSAARVYAKARYSRAPNERPVTVQNAHDQTDIVIPWQGVKHALSGEVSPVALAAVRDLEPLLREADPVGHNPDRAGRDAIRAAHFYEAPVEFDGERKTLRFVVREHPDGKRYYDHFEIKNEGPSPGEGDVGRNSVHQEVEEPSSGSLTARAGDGTTSDTAAIARADNEGRDDNLAPPSDGIEVNELTPEDLSPGERQQFERMRQRSAESVGQQQLDRQMRQESAERGEREAGERGLRQAVDNALGPERTGRVHFVRDINGVPDHVRRRSRPVKRGTVRNGLQTPEGDTYIFTDAVKTPEGAVWTAWHENGHEALRRIVENHPDVKVGQQTVVEARNRARSMLLQNPTVDAISRKIAKQRGSRNYLEMAEEALVELHSARETGDWHTLYQKYGVEIPKAMRSTVGRAIDNYVRRMKAILNAVYARMTGNHTKPYTDEDVLGLLGALHEAGRGSRKEASASIRERTERADEAPLSHEETTLDDDAVVPETEVDGGKFGPLGTKEEQQQARQKAHEFLERLRKAGRVFTNKETGWKIGFSTKGNRELKTWTAKPERIEALSVLPKLIKRATLGGSSPRDVDDVRFHYFYAPLRINGELKVARLAVREDGNGRFAYDLQQSGVVEAENPAEVSPRTPAPKAGAEAPSTGQAMTVAQMRDIVNSVDKPNWHFRGPQSEGNASKDDGPLDSVTVEDPELRPSPSETKATDAEQFDQPFPIKEGKMDKARFYLQDKFIDLQRIQEGVENVTKKVIDDARNVKQAAELFHSKTAAQIEDFRLNVEKSIIDIMHQSGLDAEQVGEWLTARHAAERNARMQAINPKVKTGSGMSDAQAEKVLAKYAENPAMQRMGKIVDWMVAKNRQMLVEGGLVPADEAAGWADMYEHYVPLSGFDAPREGAGNQPQGAGRGFDVRGKVRHAFGRDSRSANPLANLLSSFERTIVQVNKAEVGRALYKLAEDNPNSELWELDKVPSKPRLDKKTGLVTYGPDPMYKFADNVINVKIDGVDHTITLHGEQGERFAKGFKNLDAEMQSEVMRGLSRVNRYLAAVNTSLNPEFLLSNFVRDVQTANINLTGTEIKAMRGRVLLDVIPKAMPALRSVLRKGETDSEWAQYAKDFRNDGGMTTRMDAHYDVNRLTQSLAKQLRNLKRGGLHPANVFSTAGKLIEDYNKIVENAVRLSTYVHARKAGMSRPKAAHLAKNLTVNFDRKGQFGPAINSLYLFYNASAQGGVRTLKALKSPAVRKKVYELIGATAALSVANRNIGGEDEDGVAYYDKIPDYEKERNLIIMLPPDVNLPDWMESDQGGGKYIKFPMPYGYNVFKVFGDQLGDGLSVALGQKKDFQPMNSALAVMNSVIGSFNPLGSSPFTVPGQTVAPAALDPMVQIWTNKTWYGAPMYPDKNPFTRAPKPDSQRYWNSTSAVSRKIANALGQATGGDKIVPGWADISPITMDLLFNTLTGGTGATALRAINTGTKLTTGNEDIKPGEVPFARQLLGTVNARRFDRDQYYDNLTKIAQAKKELDAARTPEARQQVLNDWKPYLRSRPRSRASEHSLTLLRGRLDRLKAMDLPEPQKRKRKEKIETRMHEVRTRLNGFVEHAESEVAQ